MLSQAAHIIYINIYQIFCIVKADTAGKINEKMQNRPSSAGGGNMGEHQVARGS